MSILSSNWGILQKSASQPNNQSRKSCEFHSRIGVKGKGQWCPGSFRLARPARYADGEHMPLAPGFAAAGRVFTMQLWVKIGRDADGNEGK